jgi:hypothetical protein
MDRRASRHFGEPCRGLVGSRAATFSPRDCYPQHRSPIQGWVENAAARRAYRRGDGPAVTGGLPAGIEPDVRISRIRLSDKSSRLHPRHVPETLLATADEVIQ